MALSSRRKSGRGSSSRKRSSSSQAEPRNKKKQKTAAAAGSAAEEPEEPLFKVAKIVGIKSGKNGVKLYKTRWEGYSPADDTWEPLEHVGSTGHVDRYERKQRERTLSTYTPGVAVIEYDDGERQTINLLQEKFRSWMDISDDERDDDSVTGDKDVNDFNLIHGGAMIELLWPHAQIFFSCKIISWTPIAEVNDSKKKSVKRHGSLVWEVKDGEKVEGEAYARRSDVASITTPLLAEGAAAGCRKCQFELRTGEKSRGEHVGHCPLFKKSDSRPVDRESVEKTKLNEAPVKKKKKKSKSGEKEGVSEVKSNDIPKKKKNSRSSEGESVVEGGRNEAPKKKKEKSRTFERENAEKATNTETDVAPIKSKSRSSEKMSAAGERKHGAHTKKRSRSGKKESATEGESDDASMKKKSRKKSRSGDEESAVIATKTKSDHLPNKKKSIPNEEFAKTPHGDTKLSSETQFADDSDSDFKTSDQVQPAQGVKRSKQQKGGQVFNDSPYAKKSASIPGLPRDVSQDMSDGSIPKVFRKRNVSEGSSEDNPLFGKATKQSTASSIAAIKESLPDEMDIDALATLVSMKQSYPSMQATKNSAAGKHGGDSHTATKNDDDRNKSPSKKKDDGHKSPSKQKAKQKVGRGVPLYSDDEYDTSDDEWRGEKEFFQPAAHPRDGPKLSFEEMWMMKLQRTQTIMDRNSGARRW